MNAKKIRLSVFLILTFGFLSCGERKQAQIRTESIENWKTVKTENYTISYPPTWVLDNKEQMGIIMQLFSPLSSPKDSFSDNVNLVIQNLSGQPVNDLDKYTQLSENQIKSMMKDSKILSSKRMNRHKQEFQKIQYTAKQGIYKLKFQQYYFIKNEKAYVLTFTCEVDEFKNYSEISEKIMDSFRIN